MDSQVEGIMAKQDELAKLVVDLEARLKESKSELRVAKERETKKKLEAKVIMYKKEAVEKHEKGFNKAIRQARFFTKDLDLGLFDPFKDVKNGVLLDKEDIATEEEAIEEQDADDANV